MLEVSMNWKEVVDAGPPDKGELVSEGLPSVTTVDEGG